MTNSQLNDFISSCSHPGAKEPWCTFIARIVTRAYGNYGAIRKFLSCRKKIFCPNFFQKNFFWFFLAYFRIIHQRGFNYVPIANITNPLDFVYKFPDYWLLPVRSFWLLKIFIVSFSMAVQSRNRSPSSVVLEATGPQFWFESFLTFYLLLTLCLNYINIYKTIWWLPHGPSSSILNFYLIDRQSLAFLFVIVIFRLQYLFSFKVSLSVYFPMSSDLNLVCFRL